MTVGPRARRAAGVGAALLVLGFLGWTLASGWSKASQYDWHLEPGLFAGGVVVLVLFYLTSAAGYVAIAERLHHGGPPRRYVASVWGRSLLGRYVPGNVLMVLGRAVLLKEAGVPRRATLAATAYEQVLTLGVSAAGALVFVVALRDEGLGAGAAALALVPLILGLLHPRVFGPASTWTLTRLGRRPLARLLTAREVAGVAAIYVAGAVLLALGVWLLVRAAAGPEAGGPAYVGTAFLLSVALSLLAFIFPSGLGVREGAFAVALAQNVPSGVAVALSVGSRLVLTLVELLVIAALVAVAGRSRR